MKRRAVTKKRIVVVAVLLLFVFISCLSLITISRLKGNARVVNYVALVRGATQKLVKEELYGIPNDPLIARLDSIVVELLTGEGPNDLFVLPDTAYLHAMRQVQSSWIDLKAEILQVRTGHEPQQLYEHSEAFFNLTDRAVSLAEAFCERQVTRSIALLAGINSLFVGVLAAALLLYRHSVVLDREAEVLAKVAYLDPLTQIPNRARCEQYIRQYSDMPPEKDLAVLLFDLNDLKLINDRHGHQGGDSLICNFARILADEAKEFGFVGRFGGDEFLTIFPDASEEMVLDYLSAVNERVVAHNLQYINDLQRIRFAVGYHVGNLRERSITDMIHLADLGMYARKKKMKSHSDLTGGDET